MGFIDDAASPATLRAALEAAERNQGRPGPDGVSVATFSAHASIELARLRDELLSGAWQPRPALRLKIPKGGGGHRDLAVSCVRDRVVQHALARTLADALDQSLHPSAYAWRRGRSARECLARVDAALAEGRQWVLRGDVAAFFDNIFPELLLATLRDHTGDDALVDVVGRMLGAGTLVGGDIVDPALGTGQGSPLSPFLANLYLLPFDRAMETAGFEMFRYGDDLCAPCWLRTDAERARETAIEALGRLRLKLNPEKVAVKHLGEGFAFLGFAFHDSGRRASGKAARTLAGRLEALSSDRSAEEEERVLRGWLAYYGTLRGVDLPPPLRARAEVLEAEMLQSRQFGGKASASPTNLPPPPTTAPTSRSRETPATTDAGTPLPDRWQQAALVVQSARGTPDEPAVTAVLGQKLGLDPTSALSLVEALRRYDGAAAAEVLARAGRFEDADAVATLGRPDPAIVTAPPRAQGLPVEPVELTEAPRFDPDGDDAERLLALFGGAEHTFLRDILVGAKIERQRVQVAPTVAHVREHFAGAFWMGIFPLRSNQSTRWGAFRVTQSAKVRREMRCAALPDAVIDDARALRGALQGLGLEAVMSVEPGRALVLWLLFAEAVTAARARALLSLVSQRAGQPPAAITREIFPQQDVVRPDKPGSAMLLPLGRDARTGERSWLLDETFAPAPDACGALRAVAPLSGEQVITALGLKPRGVPPSAAKAPIAMSTAASASAPRTATTVAGPGPAASVDPVALATSPFQALPRAQEVYKGCAVLRHMVDQAVSGAGLSTSDRLLVADILGRTGDEGTPAAEAVFRHLDDHRPGMGARFVARLYPHPTSCARIRQKLPELTARVGCDCRFRVPPGAYPTPVLHVLGAAEVPGMGERVRDMASKGGLARAAMAAMNEGRKELGAKAAALCARLADLRRQAKVLERSIGMVEADLDVIVEEAGDTPLETPSGTLRRVTIEGVRRFVLEV
jgi:group II intron reverse transcriptase/maturase